MSLPDGYTQLELDGHRGVPQSAPVPGSTDMTVVLVGVAPDLAALLSADPDRQVWTTVDGLSRHPGIPPGDEDGALAAATRALLTAPGETLSAAEVFVQLLVVQSGRVVCACPVLPGRPLPVRDSRLIGHLWVDEVTLCAGALVAGGPNGSRVTIGWQPLSARTTPAVTDGQEDPYAELV